MNKMGYGDYVKTISRLLNMQNKFLDQYPQFWKPKVGDKVLINKPDSLYHNKTAHITTTYNIKWLQSKTILPLRLTNIHAVIYMYKKHLILIDQNTI